MSLPRQLPWLDAARNAAQELLRRDVHAILLHGARGIGKKSLGFELAQAMLCESAPAAARACGTCAGCVLMEAGNHPDFRFVLPDAMKTLRPGATLEESAEGEGDTVAADEPDKPSRASRELRIEQIRGLADFANIATHRGGRRVILLAPAESLNAPAANALLKLLEEPPDGTFFVLCTDALDELPPTIRSRCVLVRVEMPGKELATQWLASQGCAEPGEALLAAAGAPLAALEAENAPEIEQRHHELLLDILQNPEKGDAADIARRIPRDLVVGPALMLMQRWCWDLIAFQMTGNVRYHSGRKAVVARIATRFSAARLWEWSRSINLRQASREHPLNARLVTEGLLLQYLSCLTPMDKEPRR